MKIKFLQLNINKGQYFNNLITFLKKENFDILNLQEVAGGKISHNQKNYFEEIKSALNYQGILSPDAEIKNNPISYFANAIFLKKHLFIASQEIIRLNNYPIEHSKNINIKWPNKISRHFISLTLKQNLTIINAHLTRGETSADDKQKLAEGRILIDYVKKLKTPFILSGDFNVDPRSKLIKSLNNLAENLTVNNKITNTLNPRTHYLSKILFPPGIACDYIFIDKSLKIKNFRLIDDLDVSDHFGLAIEVEI